MPSRTHSASRNQKKPSRFVRAPPSFPNAVGHKIHWERRVLSPPSESIFERIGIRVHGIDVDVVAARPVQRRLNHTAGLVLNQYNAVIEVLVPRQCADARNYRPKEHYNASVTRAFYLHVNRDAKDGFHIVRKVFSERAPDLLFNLRVLVAVQFHVPRIRVVNRCLEDYFVLSARHG